MTNEEAITRLKGLYGNGYSEQEQALDMAIKALQENPKLIKEVEKWKTYFEEEISNEW